MYCFNPRRNPTRRSSRLCTASRRSCSSVAEQADDGELRARTQPGTAAPCWATAKLTCVSLPARPRARSVLLCVLAPWLLSMAQPDLRLHSVGGRKLSEATLEPTLDGCPAAASGSSMAARRSSRRRPRCHRGVHQWPERAAFDVRTAVCRRVCCPPPAGRSARTHCRAVWLLESLDVFRSVCPVKCDKLVHPGLDPTPGGHTHLTGRRHVRPHPAPTNAIIVHTSDPPRTRHNSPADRCELGFSGCVS